MKRIVICILMMLATATAWSQQSFTTQGNTYKPTQSVRSTTAAKDTVTPYTYEVSGTKYPIIMGKTGSCYIIRTSKKTGKEYRQYLGEEISRDICTKMGREYKAKKSNK